jgi:hypothetical protein
LSVTEVRISVTYTRSEGQGVESIDVTWDDPPDPAAVVAVIEQLVPRRAPMAFPASPPLAAGQAEELCRRALCNHPKGSHASADIYGRAVGKNEGWCARCASKDKCEYFVGAGGS